MEILQFNYSIHITEQIVEHISYLKYFFLYSLIIKFYIYLYVYSVHECFAGFSFRAYFSPFSCFQQPAYALKKCFKQKKFSNAVAIKTASHYQNYPTCHATYVITPENSNRIERVRSSSFLYIAYLTFNNTFFFQFHVTLKLCFFLIHLLCAESFKCLTAIIHSLFIIQEFAQSKLNFIM